MKKEKLTIPLNNDMTRVIERDGDAYSTYTVMGTGDAIEWDNVVIAKEPFEVEDLLDFTVNPSVEELYRKRELEYITQDFLRIAAEDMGIELSEAEGSMLAERFTEKQDSNISYNNQVENMINDHFSYDR